MLFKDFRIIKKISKPYLKGLSKFKKKRFMTTCPNKNRYPHNVLVLTNVKQVLWVCNVKTMGA
jgi:hypothetical protein